MIGRELAHYRVVAQLGAGGMGEVYRAQDTKLGREVALKVLPEAFARDPGRLARFKREAQLLAALNHPHIAAIHGLEEADGVRFLVLELVEGETLAERVRTGPLPVEEALGVCRQIAEALEAAHEKGIIHRDLKPGNVKLTPEGSVKVLDFGLAKAFAGEETAADLSRSPTITEAATRAGVLLGTAAYMSPEQARGKPVDKRADIWAFGCVLYECLTARQAFGGETVSDTIAKILEREPDWQALSPATPANILHLLRRCLQRDPHKRLQHMGDARLELAEPLAGQTVPLGAAAPTWAPALPWALAGLLLGALAAGVAVWTWMPSQPPAPQPVTRFAIHLPPGEAFDMSQGPAVALSPDGTRLVYVARRGDTTQLFLRPLDQLEAKPILGTEGGHSPFFSPDGQWVGFFTPGRLLKVSLSGGAPQTLHQGLLPEGASWGPDDTIFFTSFPGLSRISASGGPPQVLTTPDPKQGEFFHFAPEVLPGGKAVLFTVRGGGASQEQSIAVLSLEQGPEASRHRVLVKGGSKPLYVPATGHIVYAQAGTGTLLAVPFDLQHLELTGPPVPVLEGVRGLQFALSPNGSLTYLPGTAQARERTLVWVDRKGTTQPTPAPARAYMGPRLSPDGRRIALEISEASTDIWVYELARETLTRMTFEANNHWPLWTPDGKRITFNSDRGGTLKILWMPADGSGPPEQLTTGEYPHSATSWSPDGRWLAFFELHPTTSVDLWVLPMEGTPPKPGKPRPFLVTPFLEWGAVFSPDGRWLAYASDDSGRAEIYVQPFPGPGGKWQVSTEGGDDVLWAPKGGELLYRQGNKIMAVPIQTTPTFSAGKPRPLFEGRYEYPNGPLPNFDITPDGQRFLLVKSAAPEAAPTQVNIVLNWFDDLKRRVPAPKK